MSETEKFKILIVDDQESNIQFVVSFLSDKGYALSSVSSGEGALNSAFSKKFDLILLDIKMPGIDGYEVCKRLKENPSTEHIPIIFLSALDDIEAVTKAFKLGGADYISKPFNGLELQARVHTQVKLRSYLKELESKQSKLAQLAATDSLTGLVNKIYFISVLKKSMALSTKRLSLAYISIDHLNKINNMYGYKSGDQVLIKVSKVLQSSARSSDTVARLFGSEFVLLMPNTEIDKAKTLIYDIYAQLSKIKYQTLQITCSIGLSQYKKDLQYEKFIMSCEKLMEEAKESEGAKIVTKL